MIIICYFDTAVQLAYTDTDTDTLLTKKHGPRKALMTYMYRWHKCQFTRSHITNNKNIIVYINSNFYHNIWHFSHIILYQYINTSVSPCTLVCYTYWLTCRQKQGNAIYGVRTVISININHTKLCISGPFTYAFFTSCAQYNIQGNDLYYGWE